MSQCSVCQHTQMTGHALAQGVLQFRQTLGGDVADGLAVIAGLEAEHAGVLRHELHMHLAGLHIEACEEAAAHQGLRHDAFQQVLGYVFHARAGLASFRCLAKSVHVLQCAFACCCHLRRDPLRELLGFRFAAAQHQGVQARFIHDTDLLLAAKGEARDKAALEAEKAGDMELGQRIRGMFLRDMRSLAADLAGDVDEASKLLQHSSKTITEKHYRTRAETLKAVR